MKPLLLLLALPLTAHASWFEFEAGVGQQWSRDMGDGTWIQQGLPTNRESTSGTAYMLGLTGEAYRQSSVDARWHADYVYFGKLAASVDGVPDANYNPKTHQTMGDLPRLSPFSGQGHTQGLALTLEAGYMTHGYQFSAEAGPWLYWATWHESLYNLADQWQDLSHRTHMQIGYVAGAGVEHGAFGIHYRYYSASPSSNPYPGLVTGTHMVMATWRF